MSWERPGAKIPFPVWLDSLLALVCRYLHTPLNAAIALITAPILANLSTIKLMAAKMRVFKWKLAEAPPSTKANKSKLCAALLAKRSLLLFPFESMWKLACQSPRLLFCGQLHVGQKEVKLDIFRSSIAPGQLRFNLINRMPDYLASRTPLTKNLQWRLVQCLINQSHTTSYQVWTSSLF